jgi:PiT family inorganic phosphate transporter
VVLWHGFSQKVLVPSLLAPLLAVPAAALVTFVVIAIVRRRAPGGVNRVFRKLQLVSAGFVSLTHGTNDAQKTMGVITLALIAHGDIAANDFHVPRWVVVAAASAIALGTYTGGWRIIKTMGSRIIKMDSAQGFSAQGAGAAVILAASHYGYPLSTTHVIAGGVMGAGAAKRLSAVRWGVAGNIAVAWVLTLPAAAAMGAITWGVTRIFGTGAVGPLVVSIALLLTIIAVFARRLRRGSVLTAEAA